MAEPSTPAGEAGKQPTQGMAGKDGPNPRRPDGTGVPQDERGAGGGGPIGPKDQGEPFHGGQSNAAYHGTGQLGEQPVDKGENPNAPSREG